MLVRRAFIAPRATKRVVALSYLAALAQEPRGGKRIEREKRCKREARRRSSSLVVFEFFEATLSLSTNFFSLFFLLSLVHFSSSSSSSSAQKGSSCVLVSYLSLSATHGLLMLALHSSSTGRAAVLSPSREAMKTKTTPTPSIRRRSTTIITSASAEPQDFDYASPRPYSSPQAGEDLTPYFGKVHAHDAKPANTIHAW